MAYDLTLLDLEGKVCHRENLSDDLYDELPRIGEILPIDLSGDEGSEVFHMYEVIHVVHPKLLNDPLRGQLYQDGLEMNYQVYAQDRGTQEEWVSRIVEQ